MKSTLALFACVSAGCLSAGGGAAFHFAVDDSPVRRVAGGYEIGNFVEIVEDKVAGQLFYAKDLPPLGDRSEALGAWGGRITGGPLYVEAAYGQNDDVDQPYARLVRIGAGVAYARFDRVSKNVRTWTSIDAGLVYHRAEQESTNDGKPGHFLGLGVSIHIGVATFGPMFARDRE